MEYFWAHDIGVAKTKLRKHEMDDLGQAIRLARDEREMTAEWSALSGLLTGIVNAYNSAAPLGQKVEHEFSRDRKQLRFWMERSITNALSFTHDGPKIIVREQISDPKPYRSELEVEYDEQGDLCFNGHRMNRNAIAELVLTDFLRQA